MQPPTVVLPKVGIALAWSLKMLGHKPLRKGSLGIV